MVSPTCEQNGDIPFILAVCSGKHLRLVGCAPNSGPLQTTRLPEGMTVRDSSLSAIHSIFSPCCVRSPSGWAAAGLLAADQSEAFRGPVVWLWVKSNGIPFLGRRTTHFRTYFSGGIGMFTGGTGF